eukprot:Skav207079  [mRNA]  locus=scaffold1909:520327:525366:+ [translate_table: standard]
MTTNCSHGLVLEPSPATFIEMGVGNIRGDLVIYDEGQKKHLFRSTIHHYLFTVEVVGQIDIADAFSFLQARMTKGKYGLHVIVDAGNAMEHDKPSYEVFGNAVETCAGMGFLGQGLQSAGIEVKVLNELRPSFCSFRSTRGCDRTIEGDIHDTNTWKLIHHAHKQSCILTAGFSCQPWSRLGDQAQQHDDRAQVFTSILHAAYHLRMHTLILECVVGAGADPWIQAQITDFCRQTGARNAQQELSLQSLFPAVRNRWWCLITSVVMPCPVLPPLPINPMHPSFGDLLPELPLWPAEEVAQLRLDQYETRKFHGFGGLGRNLIRQDKPVPTALHGWANQLTGCPCQCRSHPMSEHRLDAKGLFGALLVIEGSFWIDHQDLPATRHIHPWELALVNGVNPNQQWMPHLRFSICGLGQMASPVQACWVAGHYQQGVAYILGTHVKSPQHMLWDHIQSVLQGMSVLNESLVNHPKVLHFAMTTKAILQVNQASVSPETPVPGSVATSHAAFGSDRDGNPGEGDKAATDKTPLLGHGGKSGLAITFDNYFGITGGTSTTEPAASKGPASLAPATSEITRGTNATTVSEVTDTQLVRALDALDSDGRPVPTQGAAKRIRPTSVFSQQGGVIAFSTGVSKSKVSKDDIPKVHADKPQGINQEDSCTDKPDHDPTTAIEPSTKVTEELEAPEKPESPRPLPALVTEAPPSRTFADELRGVAGIGRSEDPPNRAVTPPVLHVPSVEPASHQVMVVREGDAQASLVRVHRNATVGEISVAEHRLQGVTMPAKVVSAVGVMIPLGDTTSPNQQVHVLNMPCSRDSDIDPVSDVPGPLRNDAHQSRLGILYQQGPFVADDEMNFWLTLVEKRTHHTLVPICVIRPSTIDEDIRDQLMGWIRGVCEALHQRKTAFSCLLVNGHWIPLVVRPSIDCIEWYTTPEGKAWVEVGLQLLPDNVTIQTVLLPKAFNSDCGFQSYHWITKVLTQCSSGQPISVDCLPHAAAVDLRAQFEHHLIITQEASVMHTPSSIGFGGGQGGDLSEQLRQLLADHGVPEKALTSRVEAVINALGRAPVQGALRGPRPWKDLKGLANTASPKLQLVLANELEEAIRSKTSTETTFGDKQKKKVAPPPVPVIVAPEDVQIPNGLFTDSHGNAINQITMDDVSQDAQGFVITTVADATPYLRVSSPVSVKSLAILILDHHAPQVQGIGEVIRTPAQCAKTSEAIILTCRIVQIGSTAVVRHMPTTAIQVEEVPNWAVRVVIFRDEWEQESGTDWDSFCRGPVKELIAHVPELGTKGGKNEVIDCWDRQFLSHAMQRSRPIDAQMFLVSFRLQTKEVEVLMTKSGKCGIYIEPRDASGRRPSETYRVVWLGKATKQEALVALRATSPWSCLARTNRRYGIRVRHTDVLPVHKQHKPATPYLDTSGARAYTGGPFPFGATRASLTRVFSEWSWSARPNQPVGRSIDNKGVMWSILASEAPAFEVYTMKHADVLLTEVTRKPKDTAPAPIVQGSAKTIAALKQNISGPMPAGGKSETDPFLSDDPWAKAKFPKVAEQLSSNVDVKLAQMEKRLMQQMQTQLDAKEDEEMIPAIGDSQAIAAFEQRIEHRLAEVDSMEQQFDQRLAALEQTVHHNQQQQASHNQEVANRIQQLNSKVDAQTASIQSHMDAKLGEQLSHIERLLRGPRSNGFE